MKRECESAGKSCYRSIAIAEGSARASARRMNREGLVSTDLYVYRHPDCGSWHLTKRPEWDGRPNVLVFTAPPADLQHWAITGEMP